MQKKGRPSYTGEFKKRAVELTREKGVDAVGQVLGDYSYGGVLGALRLRNASLSNPSLPTNKKPRFGAPKLSPERWVVR